MTTFTFGGTALTSFGKVTIVNDYLDLPERRGDNQLIPYKHGTVFTQKYYDQRTITLGIAINAASGSALESTFDNMRKLFSPRAEQVLAMTMEDSTVRNAYASVNKSIQVDRRSDKVALAVIEFDLSSPFWRLSTAIADNTVTVNASPKAWTVTNPGTVQETDPIITLVGPLTNPVITNTTNSVSLTYTGAISAGGTILIGSTNGEYYATLGGTTSVIGNVTHSGNAALMVFEPGANTLSITSSVTTTGTVKASFYAPFL